MTEKSGGYAVQINVKVGDHLINVQGDTPEEAVANLLKVQESADVIHEAMARLDGRPATEIVPKQSNSWGARSQTRAASPRPQTPPAVQQLQDALGAAVTGVQPNPAPQYQAAPAGGPPTPPGLEWCQLHGSPRAYAAGGVSQRTGNPYGASWRCSQRGCAPVWQNRDGSWPQG